MSVADNVKRFRKQKGWSQVRLSMEAHVSQQAISFIERGRNEPSTEMIRALSKALRVSPSELIGEEIGSANKIGHKETKLLEIFDLLNEAGKDFLLQQAEAILQQAVFRKDESVASVR